ncbi:hypothetical protein TRVL_00579 [Trypanosoma vivax]|uniref:Uncharacterized protein n=1 Tax=Trypanosoma vivax (strain Y486) TaxID=1055687 RepID=G0TTD1_TRYVY|nr:hypothetical protein TRVL_00579 [Trypanosoma vivax]CCC47212.1 hypothetical protein, unlikely [Trypanosoma vivax Y486]
MIKARDKEEFCGNYGISQTDGTRGGGFRAKREQRYEDLVCRFNSNPYYCGSSLLSPSQVCIRNHIVTHGSCPVPAQLVVTNPVVLRLLSLMPLHARTSEG